MILLMLAGAVRHACCGPESSTSAHLLFAVGSNVNEGWLYIMHIPGLNAVEVGYTARAPSTRRRELTMLTGFYRKLVYAKRLEDARGGSQLSSVLYVATAGFRKAA